MTIAITARWWHWQRRRRLPPQVVAQYDEVVVPYTSGYLSGQNTTNVKLQDRCPAETTEHLRISYDPVAIQWVLNALARSGPADPGFQPVC